MAVTLSLINMKGGVGKSTLAVNLAAHLSYLRQWKKDVLLVDLDPQFNASQYLLGQGTYRKILGSGVGTVWDILEQRTMSPGGKARALLDPKQVIHKHRAKSLFWGKLDIVPSRLELAHSLRQPGEKVDLLERFLAKVKGEYDLVIIDCAPTESILSTAAYLASDYLLVPVRPEYLSSIGLPLLAESVAGFQQSYDRPTPEIAGVVFNHCTEYAPEESISKSEVREIGQRHGWYVFKSELSYSRSYPKGAREGRPIFETSYAHTSRKVEFERFARELAGRIGL